MGIDTHALSGPALRSALEVLAANDVELLIAPQGEFTPTPAVSHADPGPQPRSRPRVGGWHCDHAFPQSSRERRIQVQPPDRRTGRHIRNQTGFRIAPMR